MKKTYLVPSNTPARPVYGLTPVGLREFRAFQRDLGLYLGVEDPDFVEGRRWAEAAEKAYARDPEDFILTGIVNGHTREEAVLGLVQYLNEPDRDDYVALLSWL